MNPLILLDVAGRIADRLAQSHTVPVDNRDKPEIKREVVQELKPVIEHLTNNEPAIQSRVTQGAVGAIIIAGGTLLYSWSKGALSEEIISTQGGIILSACWVLYGRWKAKKPLLS